MKKPAVVSPTSIDLLLSSISDVVRYSIQKKRYECEQIVLEQMRKVREAVFSTEADESAVITRELQRYKTKLEVLELEIEQYPEDTRDAWQPLIDQLELKITMTRQKRSGMKLK